MVEDWSEILCCRLGQQGKLFGVFDGLVKLILQAMFFTMGSLTFKEAYERTGRALNVTVVPSDRHS